MAQAVCCQPFTLEAQVLSLVSPCEIYCGIGFFEYLGFSHVSIILPVFSPFH